MAIREEVRRGVEIERGMWSRSNGELRRGSIGGGVMQVWPISELKWCVESERGGEIGVPAADVGGVWSIDARSKGESTSFSGCRNVYEVPMAAGATSSGPVLAGLLITLGIVPPEQGQEVLGIGRGSKGAGESMEAVDMVSNSGVSGSR
jgi:hypothetical protein